jgi:FkbM family methyltransferase
MAAMYGLTRASAIVQKPLEARLNDTKELSVTSAVDSAGAATRYVWEVEGALVPSGEVSITIGDIEIPLNLAFVHERRYALGYLFGFRNPQADIDRLILQQSVRSGDVVLDAGANIGVTAAEALACGACHVVCAEAENSLVGRLDALRVRYADRVTVCHCALGATEGFAELLLSMAHNQGHTTLPAIRALFPTIFGDQWQKVPASTIDYILSKRPADIWKLDVEGAEADVIRGARLTLKRSPPRVIIAELYDPFVGEVIDLLSGYRVKRAALTRTSYELCFLDQIGGQLREEFCPTSPVYAFTRQE